MVWYLIRITQASSNSPKEITGWFIRSNPPFSGSQSGSVNKQQRDEETAAPVIRRSDLHPARRHKEPVKPAQTGRDRRTPSGPKIINQPEKTNLIHKSNKPSHAGCRWTLKQTGSLFFSVFCFFIWPLKCFSCCFFLTTSMIHHLLHPHPHPPPSTLHPSACIREDKKQDAPPETAWTTDETEPGPKRSFEKRIQTLKIRFKPADSSAPTNEPLIVFIRSTAGKNRTEPGRAGRVRMDGLPGLKRIKYEINAS